MKKLGIERAASLVEDASIVREVKRTPRWERIALIAVVIAVFAASLWPAYLKYGKPWLDQRTLDAALLAYSQEGEDRRQAVEKMKALPREHMLLVAHEVLVDHPASLEASRAALDLAISEGSAEAGLKLGKGLRDGVFGEKDNVAALKQFERVKRAIDAGVKVGDPIALYSHAFMLSEGLGLAVDRTASAAAMRRAAEGLSGWRLRKVAGQAAWGLGAFEATPDHDLAKRLASRLMDEGDKSAYAIGQVACVRDLTEEQEESESRDAARKRRKGENACHASWSERGANAGDKSAMAEHATQLLQDADLLGAKTWFEAAGSARDDRANFGYGLVQAINADDLPSMAAGVKMIWAAQVASKTEKYSTLSDRRADDSSVLLDLSKVLSDRDKWERRRNVVIALLARAELAGTMAGTLSELRWGDPLDDDHKPRLGNPDSLRAFAELPVNRRSARQVAEAIRSNRLVSEVLAAEADRAQGTSTHRSAAKATAPDARPDAEQQARSGYLPKAPSLATDGLSTFNVDNTGGQHDVVVRLYLGSSMPAVRGFYVKRGESFKAQSLRAGTYAMRYRHIGSEET